MLLPQHVILIDDHDNQIGVEEKLRAHQDGGKLHRAFSVFVFNSRGELLLQRRAAGKYHFAGLWSNTCCGHPRPGEATAAAAERRLFEEFGFRCALREAFTYTYVAHDPASGLTERELVHAFVGRYEGDPSPDPAEIDEWRWAAPASIRREIEQRPQDCTPWFRIALPLLDDGAVGSVGC